MKVIDFGLSIEKQEYDNCRVGSPYYMAPEMINGEFYYESDIWSIGVILYLMVTGHYAFYAKHKRKLFDKIKEGKYNNERLNEVSCSEELKDLIRKLLIVNHKKRLSIQGILEHPFFKLKTNIIKEHKLDSKIIDSLREFNNKNLFQKEILFLMARISKESEIHKLREAFEIIDKDKTGEIKYSEIPIIFQKIGIKPNEGEIDNIWNSLDFHQDGKINYTEFLAATISSIKFEKEEKLWSVFQYFDEDDDGFISGDSIINALKINNDLNIQEKELSNLLKGLSNSKFDFEEFKKIFFDDNYIDHKNTN
jgi:calcium-dependent protein kinase